MKPDRKVSVGAAVSGVMAAIVWALNTYVLEVPIPAEIGMGIATAATFGIQYFIKNETPKGQQ